MADSFTPMLLPTEKSQATTTQTTATMVLLIRRLAGSPVSTGVSATHLQVLSNKDGRPLYIVPVELGATHDITAAEKHIFDAVGATRLWFFAEISLSRFRR